MPIAVLNEKPAADLSGSVVKKNVLVGGILILLMGGTGSVLRLLEEVGQIANGQLLLVVEARIAGDLLQGERGVGVVPVADGIEYAVVENALHFRIGGNQRRLQPGNALLHCLWLPGGYIFVATHAAKNKQTAEHAAK